MFNFFKKKKDVKIDYELTDLNVGFVFEYDLETWVVKESYEYDWGNESFSYEHKVTNGKDTLYLAVEVDDELYITLSKKVPTAKIVEGLSKYVSENKQPPEKLEYDGKTFYFDEESAGYYRDMSKGTGRDDDDWTEFISWDYYDEDEEYNINIEQWDEKSFEVSYGKMLKAFQISNILPAS